MAINADIRQFFGSLANPVEVSESTKLVDVLDSLAFLDFFLFLERSFPDTVSLDDVARCTTVSDLSYVLDAGAQVRSQR